MMVDPENCAIYLKISREILESIDAGGYNEDDKVVVETVAVSREERIKMHAVRKKETRKRKAGGVPPAIVNYVPPVPTATLDKLKQLNQAEKKLPRRYRRVQPTVNLSKEMDQALSRQIHGLTSSSSSSSSSSLPSSISTSKSNRKYNRSKIPVDIPTSSSAPIVHGAAHDNPHNNLHNDPIQYDFWENRLTSTLARPLGIEALIRSRPLPTSKTETAAPSFVSDQPDLDAAQFRLKDQLVKVERAAAVGQPVLDSSHNPNALQIALAERDRRMNSESPPPPVFAYNSGSHVAANKIQTCARIRRQYKETSATKVQSMFRAFFVYREIVRERRRHNLAAACIQCIHRGNTGRRWAKWAQFILHLQQIGRCWLARRRVHELRTRRRGLQLYLGDVYIEAGKRLFVYKRAARIIQRHWRWIWMWRQNRKGAAVTIQRYARKWLSWLRLKYYLNAVILQKTIGRGALCRIAYVHKVQVAIHDELQRSAREAVQVDAACQSSRRAMVQYISGPCGVPSLSLPLWLCMGRDRRNGRRYYKMMRKRIKDQAKACDHYTHTLRKEDRDVNRKRKMQWKQENKEEKARAKKDKKRKARENKMMKKQAMLRKKRKMTEKRATLAEQRQETRTESTETKTEEQSSSKLANTSLAKENVVQYSFKEWLKGRKPHRTYQNIAEKYRVDRIVWSYCRGDGVLHAADLPKVLQELGCGDRLTWAQQELFRGKAFSLTVESGGEPVVDSSSDPAIDPAIDPVIDPTIDPAVDSSVDPITLMSSSPSPPQPALQSQPKTVTREEFQQWWFGSNRTQHFAAQRCQCTSIMNIHCFDCSTLGRSAVRRTARGTVDILGMSLTRWTKRRIFAEVERRVRNDTLESFRTSLNPYWDYPPNKTGKRLWNAPRFQCEVCLCPFTLWRPYISHCTTCQNNVRHTSAIRFEFSHVDERQESLAYDGTGDTENAIEAWVDFEGDIPRFEDLVKRKWMHRAVARLNVHLEDSATLLSSRRLTGTVENERASAIIEFRTLAWSLCCIESGGMDNDNLMKVTKILWGPTEWSQRRHMALYRLLCGNSNVSNRSIRDPPTTLQDENGELIPVPFQCVLEFWLGERVYQNSLVPASLFRDDVDSALSSLMACCNHSTIRSRWKRVVQNESIEGYLVSVEECARHHYYLELGAAMLSTPHHHLMDKILVKNPLEITSRQILPLQNRCREENTTEYDKEEKVQEEIQEETKWSSTKVKKAEIAHSKVTEQSIYATEVQTLLMTREEANQHYPMWVVLHSLGFTLEMSVYALRTNHGSLDAAEQWLLRQSFDDLQRLRAVLFSSKDENVTKGCKADGTESQSTSKADDASELCLNEETKEEEKQEEEKPEEEEFKALALNGLKVENKERIPRMPKLNKLCISIGKIVTTPVRKTQYGCQILNKRWYQKSSKRKQDAKDVQDVLNNIVQQIVDASAEEREESIGSTLQVSTLQGGSDIRKSIGSIDLFGTDFSNDSESTTALLVDAGSKTEETKKEENVNNENEKNKHCEENDIDNVKVPLADKSMEIVLNHLLQRMTRQIKHAVYLQVKSNAD